MLAQLLRKHGLGAAVLPHAAGSRAAIGALDGSGVAMVCLSYLELVGSPSHLRYLVRRLAAAVTGGAYPGGVLARRGGDPQG